MNIKLLNVLDKSISIDCRACGENSIFKVTDLILATSEDTTTHEVRLRAVCKGCGVRGDNTYAII